VSMNKQEFARLMAYHIAAKRAPRKLSRAPSKRTSKHMGTGQMEIRVFPKIIPSSRI